MTDVRNEGRNLLLTAALLVAPCAAQYSGSFGVPFDHLMSQLPEATDPGLPFAVGGVSAMQFYHPAFAPKPAGLPVPLTGAPPPHQTTGRLFNALHMCLIPKGPNRGKVLVWDLQLVLAKTPGFITQSASEYYSLQTWAIVDPNPQPGALQFENFFLPVAPVDTSVLPTVSPNLFCAGHA